MSCFLTYILTIGEEIEAHLSRCQLHVGFEEYLMIKEYDGDLQAYEYQLVSKFRLHEQIDQIIPIFEKKQSSANEHSQEQQKLRVLELKNIVNKIICRFKTMQKDPKRFRKMQNMLHILGFEVKLLKILERNNLRGDELILVYRIVQFMEFFSKDNPRHSWFLETHFKTFLDIACPRISVSKLIVQMITLNTNTRILQSNFRVLLACFVRDFQHLLHSQQEHLTNEERRDTYSRVCKSSDYLRIVVAFLCAEQGQCSPSFKTQFLDTVLRVSNQLKLFNFDFFRRVIELSEIANKEAQNSTQKKSKIYKNRCCEYPLLTTLLAALSLCSRQQENRHMLNKLLSIRRLFEEHSQQIRDINPRKKKLAPSQKASSSDFITLFSMVGLIRSTITSSRKTNYPCRIKSARGSFAKI